MEDFRDLIREKREKGVYRQEYRRLKGKAKWEGVRLEDIRCGDIVDLNEFMDGNFVAGSIHEALSDCYINAEGLKCFNNKMIERYY